MAEISKPKRSRGGCSSCRRLKIKCDETRPICEYCQHTHRNCEYLPPKPRKPRSKKPKVIELFREDSVDSYLSVSTDREGSLVADLNVQCLVNSSSQQLGLTRLELRLLNFFNMYCVDLFTYGCNTRVERVWREEVPTLFASSNLVRQAVFSFSCINLWPLCDLLALRDLDREIDRMSLHFLTYGRHTFQTEPSKDITPASHPVEHQLYNVPLDSDEGNESLYIKTANYFLECVRSSQRSQETMVTANENYVNPNLKFEIIISGMIIFAFLGIHPHRIMPLVNFGDEIEFVDKELQQDMFVHSEGYFDSPHGSDFLSFCRGFELSLLYWQYEFSMSPYRDLMMNSRIKRPATKNFKYPLVLKIKQHLSENYIFSEINSAVSDEINTLSEAILNLDICIYKSMVVNYPVPFLVWIFLLSNKFHLLVRKKNRMALYLLYIFSLKSLFINFSLFEKSNMWIDYIHWYRERYDTTTFDEKFYHLVVIKHHRVKHLKYNLLGSFDPEIVYDNLQQGIKDPILI